MIAKITFKRDSGDEYTMLFGDSYKSWEEQYEEYICMWRNKGGIHPVSLSLSNSKWIGFGGLKWCSEESFQPALNREGSQDNEPDNKNPRQYTAMKFTKDPLSNLPTL